MSGRLIFSMALWCAAMSPGGAAAMATESVSPPAPTDHESAAQEAVKDLIWQRERQIQSDLAAGSAASYKAYTLPEYVSWPRLADRPVTYADVPASGNSRLYQPGQPTDLELTGFTLSGDVAIVYFRAVVALPEPGKTRTVDYIHCWKLQDGDWKMLGGMSRTAKSS